MTLKKGTDGNDVLNGGSGADSIVGLLGEDTLHGFGGIDTLVGGGGDDVLYYDSADSINGGAGTDTLLLTQAGIAIDAGSAHFASIEAIDLTGTGDNILQVTAAEIVSLAGGVLRVTGNAGDEVQAGGGWTYNGRETIAGASYFEYLKGDATLQVGTQVGHTGIGLTMHAADPVARLPVPSVIGGGNPWGTVVSAAGDVNGDGFEDFIVGSSKESSYGGAAYVIFGKASGIADMAYPTLDGSNGFTIAGDDANNERAGVAVSGAGDLNGDGLADMIVGAHDGGNTYVILGKQTWPASVATSDLVALNATGEYAGRSASVAGDVNGDGRDDLIIGAPYDAGGAYLVFGHGGAWTNLDLTAMSASQGVHLTGAAPGDQAGYSVKGAGDVNGDGFDDLIIGAPRAAPGSAYEAGAAYVVFGRKSGWTDVDLSALDPAANGFEITGAAADDRAGWSVSGAGDVNGDGFDDLLVGAPANRYDFANPVTSPGAAYLLFGKAGGWSDVDLGALSLTDGVRLSGAADNDYAGLSVSAAGDVNADGYDDFLLGAFDDQGAITGASYLVFGKASGWSDITLSSLTGSDAFAITADNGATYSGITVSAAGDVDGDGFDDLATAASDPHPHDSGNGFLFAVGGALFQGGDFRGEIDLPGTNQGDLLTGDAGVNRMVGGRGQDTLDGRGGADVGYGGAGPDVFIYRGGTLDLRLDGGSGVDRLLFAGSASSLDFTHIADNRIVGFEVLDLSGGGADTVKLSARDVLHLSDTTNRVTVNGEAGDAVDLTGNWSDIGPKTIGGVLYEQYSSGVAQVLVETGISVI